MWIEKIKGNFNMQGGFNPAYFNESFYAMRRILELMWDRHRDYKEILVHVDRMDFSDIHQFSISPRRGKPAICFFQQSGLINEIFETNDEIIAFFENCKLIPAETMVKLKNQMIDRLACIKSTEESKPGGRPSNRP